MPITSKDDDHVCFHSNLPIFDFHTYFFVSDAEKVLQPWFRWFLFAKVIYFCSNNVTFIMTFVHSFTLFLSLSCSLVHCVCMCVWDLWKWLKFMERNSLQFTIKSDRNKRKNSIIIIIIIWWERILFVEAWMNQLAKERESSLKRVAERLIEQTLREFTSHLLRGK